MRPRAPEGSQSIRRPALAAGRRIVVNLGARAITLDHVVSAALVAPVGLHGLDLVLAVVVAQWAILIGPLALVVVWIVGTAGDRSSAVATGFAAALALVLAAILSTLIDAPRPFVDGGAFNYLHHVRDGSFPSDHATLAFAIAVGFWRRRPSRAPFLWLPLAVVAIAIGWARVFLSAHYLSDIAGGAVVGAVAVAVVAIAIGWARVFLSAHYLSDIAGGAVVGAVAVAVTTTPIARTALGGLDAVGEHLRAGALATWGRLLARTTEGQGSR